MEEMLEGSAFLEDINRQFSASMTNVVRWREVEEGGKEINSSTNIKVEAEVPRWASIMPVGTIERVGSGVMQQVLNLMVPRFLAQLQKDYDIWSSGDLSRKPVTNGSMDQE
ncbi:MAG: hypothetical protein WDW36_000380 [Sanguina aurantia]